MIRQSARAESTQLSHLFGIAMTAIVITVALTSAADYVQNQRTQVAEQQLETIGNRLAEEVERVDELGRQGGHASVRVRLQRTVSGMDYEVRLGEGDTCEAGNFDTDRCLVLRTVSGDARATVPLNVSDDFSISETGGGTFRLSVEGANTRPGTRSTVVDRSLRIGVGRDFEADQFATVGSDINRPPVAKIDFSPGNPQAGTPVEFTAVESFDPDRNIVQYRWDFNGDGIVDALGRNVSRDLPPGPTTVVLTVVDTDEATSTTRTTLRVSGLRYETDLSDTDVGTDEGAAMTFTVTNNWPDQVDASVQITHILIDPKWDGTVDDGEPGFLIDNECADGGVACPYGSGNTEEVIVDAGLDGDADGSATIRRDADGDISDYEIPPDGIIVELDRPVSLFSGESAEVWVGSFLDLDETSLRGDDDLSNQTFDIGVRYEVNGKRNSTVLRDTVGAPSIEEYTIETGLGPGNNQTEAVIVSDRRLDRITIQLGGALGGVQTGADPDVERTQLPDGRWVHRLPLGEVDSGVVKANITIAENDSVSAVEARGPKTLRRSAVVLGGSYVWNNASHWDAGFEDRRVVHADVGSRTPGSLRLGYGRTGVNLTGYWHFDGSAVDASGNNRDGAPVGVGTGFGTFGSPSYRFSGGYVTVPGIDAVHSNTSSLAFWIKTTETGTDQYWNAPGITGVEQVGGGDDIFWGWIDGTGRIGIQAGDVSGPRSQKPINDGRWHHVVLTYDAASGAAKIYIDGELNATATTATGGTSMAFDDIGRIGNTATGFEGQLDEVRSYDRVLGDDDARRLAKTKGSIRTDWRSGAAINASKLRVQYEAEIPLGTEIEVTVDVDTDGDGTVDASSNATKLLAGDGSRRVGGLDGVGDASRYRLRITLETDSPTKTPVLHQIGLEEQ